MRDNGHEPCAVIETSPANRQAWVRVSRVPLPPKPASPPAAAESAVVRARMLALVGVAPVGQRRDTLRYQSKRD